MAQELKVIADFYDFMLWLMHHTEKFPRHHRYCLGLAMENRLQTILSLLLHAKYSREKAELLGRANLEVEVLRFQIRLAKDLKVLPVKSHGFAAKTLQSIGSQIGGWLKSTRPSPGAKESSADFADCADLARGIGNDGGLRPASTDGPAHSLFHPQIAQISQIRKSI